jgi:hypothetical protein
VGAITKAPDIPLSESLNSCVGCACACNRALNAVNFSGGTMRNSQGGELNWGMQFEDQSAAMRQMKELLRDQAKFRAKLDRVVRKIETSSQRTAKLAERNKTRKQPASAKAKQAVGTQGAVEQTESEKVHGDKLHAFDNEADHAHEEHHEEAISGQAS